MKKLIAILCLAAMLISMIAACDTTDSPETSGEDQTTLSPDTSGDVTTAPGESEEDTSGSETNEESNTETTVPDVTPDTPVNTEKATVYFTSPAIKAENGKTLDLSLFDVEMKSGTVVEGEKIDWSSSDLKITDGKLVVAPQSGVYKLTAKSSDGEKTIYLVSKAADETEYVLYYNDFSDAKISDFTIVQETSGKASISNGKLTLNASSSTSAYIRILLPEFLGDFGDYRITANATITAQKNEKRWTSVMYRVQNNNYPYYQLAVRQNATLDNGVELAERTSADAWNVRHKGPFSEKLSASKTYTLVADVYGNYSSATINGKKITDGKDFDGYRIGRIGLQVNGCTAVYDDIKVVLFDNETSLLPPGATDVAEVETNIINSASVIAEVTSADVLNSLVSSSVSAAIMNIDAQMNIIDKDGKTIASFENAMKALDGKVIPIFRPANSDAASKLCQYVNQSGAPDVMILSSDEKLLASARAEAPTLMGILDLRSIKLSADNMKAQLDEIRERSNAAYSRICLLDTSFASKVAVEYLQRRATTVWFDCNSENIVDYMTCITSGANGILASNASTLVDAMGSKYFAANSIIRTVQVIGHRGIPSKGPENTIEGSTLAIDYGATIVENDIMLTKDGVIVVMHDSTIDRTTNGSGSVSSMTYEQLSKYVVDSFSGTTAKIPTLEDYFKEYKNKDVVIFIEIKTTDTAIVPALKKLIDQYDILDQCAVISFNIEQFKHIREQIPGLSCGYLTSGLNSLESILYEVTRNDATFNPNQSLLTPELVRALSLRGISAWPWTVNKTGDFDKYILAGAAGITTNYSDFASGYIKSLDADKTEYTFKAGESADVKLTSLNYKRVTNNVSIANMIHISGNETVKFENGKLTATAAGTAYVMFSISFRLNNGTTVYVYTQPVTVNVQ